MDHFIKEMPTRIDEFDATLKQGDPEKLSRLAHALKGSAGNLGATRIAALVLRLEKMGEEENALDKGQAIRRLPQPVEEIIPLKQSIVDNQKEKFAYGLSLC